MSEETRHFQRLHLGVTSEQARDVRARAWAFVFDCHMKKSAADMTSTNGTSVRNTEEVSDVDLRPD